MFDTQQLRNGGGDRVARHFRAQKTEYRSDGDVGAFERVPILPTLQDLREKHPFLTPNIVEGAYSDVKEYLGTQFHLLREDYVAPFRSGVQMFRQLYLEGHNLTRGLLNRIEGVNFYMDATFDHPKRHRLPAYLTVLRLAWPDCNFIDWDNTDRLKSGCLLGLSNDFFCSIELAVVSYEQTAKLSKRGLLIVDFLDKLKRNKNTGRWMVIENSSAYFEAYRHNLQVIQSMASRHFPLKQYLAYAQRVVSPPAFAPRIESLDFTPILKKDASIVAKSAEWPPLSDTILNVQQYRALQSAFSRELCVIQGPPGTGKTFVALRIVEMLLLNSVSRRPILVVCYTNHALDQFLEGMLNYTNNIVRVGGSSKSAKLKAYTLNELMKSSNTLKTELSSLECDRDECKRRLDHLNGNAILSDEEITLHTEQLEQFLELSPSTGQGLLGDVRGAEFTKPRRDANFLRDQDRGEIEKRRNTLVSRRLLASEISTAQRATVQKNLRDHDCKQPSKAQVAKVHQLVERGLPLNLRHRWTLYRYEHWRYIGDWAANYVNKCLTLAESHGIYLSQRSAIRSGHLAGDPMSLAITWLKWRIKEIDDRTARLRREQRPQKSKQEAKEKIITSSRVIGMTTTGAAKFNNLLMAARPEIVIVEEAAEVLESHLIASLTPSTKQLILIGDHQQLQPSTAVHRLAVDFGMEVSLFERLVKNQLDYVKLQEQHRMRDEFLALLVPNIYENYFSHSVVEAYPNIRGITSNMFFMEHSHKELADPQAHSKSNTFEAEIVVRLAYYFLVEGYKESEITILATYRGQVAAIEQEVTNFCHNEGYSELQDVERIVRAASGKREIVTERVAVNPSLPLSPFEGMRITTVDNYQGEENKIVIVSLVRSNAESKIGFLSRENRVCVALSRAKHGLYCIGDIPLLANASPLWAHISKVLKEKERIGKGFELVCDKHANRKIARLPADFDEWSKRGCGEPCGTSLPCGHLCLKACHRVDATHEAAYQCEHVCSRTHPCGHLCRKPCREPCGVCVASTLKTLECGHKAKGKCCENVKCWRNILWSPSCGHDVYIPCWFKDKPDLLCGKPVVLSRPCGHHLRASCNAKIVNSSCPACASKKGRRTNRRRNRSFDI